MGKPGGGCLLALRAHPQRSALTRSPVPLPLCHFLSTWVMIILTSSVFLSLSPISLNWIYLQSLEFTYLRSAKTHKICPWAWQLAIKELPSRNRGCAVDTGKRDRKWPSAFIHSLWQYGAWEIVWAQYIMDYKEFHSVLITDMFSPTWPWGPLGLWGHKNGRCGSFLSKSYCRTQRPECNPTIQNEEYYRKAEVKEGPCDSKGYRILSYWPRASHVS